MKYIPILLVASCLSCATSHQLNVAMNNWEGVHIKKVIDDLGPPERIMENESGRKVYIFSAVAGVTADSPTGAATKIPDQPLTADAYKMFYTTDGYVTEWAIRTDAPDGADQPYH